MLELISKREPSKSPLEECKIVEALLKKFLNRMKVLENFLFSIEDLETRLCFAVHENFFN